MSQEISQSREELKEDWTKEQDTLIRNLVSLYGTHDWAIVAENVNATFPHSNKASKDCSERWQNYLSGGNAKEPWSEQEELNMILAHKKYKNRWSDMAESLKGRNNNTIKNKFYSVFRKIKGKIQKNDFSYDSKLELLEIHYIISLIEYYLAHPTQNPKTKGKRGKDFIYSLIHNLNNKMVADYKQKIQEITKHEGTMDDLFNELSTRHKASGDTSNSPPRPRSADEYDPRKFDSQQAQISCIPAVDSASTNKSTAPINIQEDDLLKNAAFNREAPFDNSPFFEVEPAVQPFLFSPTALSAGPAAAAAGAAKAACFGNPVGGFSDFSNIMKSANEERRADPGSRGSKITSVNYLRPELSSRGLAHSMQMPYTTQFYAGVPNRAHYYYQ